MVASYTHLHKVEGLNKLICHLIDIQHKIQVTLAVIKETGRSHMQMRAQCNSVMQKGIA